MRDARFAGLPSESPEARLLRLRVQDDVGAPRDPIGVASLGVRALQDVAPVDRLEEAHADEPPRDAR